MIRIIDDIRFIPWRRLLRFIPLIIVFSIIVIFVWQNENPKTVSQCKRHSVYTSPFFSIKECSPDEQRIAKHFTADTLPGLLRRGFIHKYQRSALGTSITVNGRLWRQRSNYFKVSLLTEISIYNKVQGFELSTNIVDSVSKKLYASVSPSAKMDFYD